MYIFTLFRGSLIFFKKWLIFKHPGKGSTTVFQLFFVVLNNLRPKDDVNLKKNILCVWDQTVNSEKIGNKSSITREIFRFGKF